MNWTYTEERLPIDLNKAYFCSYYEYEFDNDGNLLSTLDTKYGASIDWCVLDGEVWRDATGHKVHVYAWIDNLIAAPNLNLVQSSLFHKSMKDSILSNCLTIVYFAIFTIMLVGVGYQILILKVGTDTAYMLLMAIIFFLMFISRFFSVTKVVEDKEWID